MWRRVLLVLLCVMIPWQAVTAAQVAVVHADDAVSVIEHLKAHDNHVAHHHDHHAGGHHGGIHYDQSQDSKDHVGDHCVCSTGWLPPLGLNVMVTAPAVQMPPEWTARPLPAPVLEKPPRPPRYVA